MCLFLNYGTYPHLSRNTQDRQLLMSVFHVLYLRNHIGNPSPARRYTYTMYTGCDCRRGYCDQSSSVIVRMRETIHRSLQDFHFNVS